VHHRRSEALHRAALSATPAVSRPAPAGTAPLARPAPGRALSPAQVLQLQHRVGNGAVGPLLGGVVQRVDSDDEEMQDASAASSKISSASAEASEEGEAVQDDAADPLRPAGARFARVKLLADTLLANQSKMQKHPIKQMRIQLLRYRVSEAVKLMEQRKEASDVAQRAYRNRRPAKTANPYWKKAKTKNKDKNKSPSSSEYLGARADAAKAFKAYEDQAARARDLAGDTINELWKIGENYLPTHLMPVGAVFRDKPGKHGDPTKFTYHTGSDTDPIPITWYKDPADYPRLKVPVHPPSVSESGSSSEMDTGAAGAMSTGEMSGGAVSVEAEPAAPQYREVSFGQPFSVGGFQFGVAGANEPREGWLVRKTLHHETREGQKEANNALTAADVRVGSGGGGWVDDPFRHGFDGDHVKDLGFGGTDRKDNYWPLDSVINRRAFTGYNSGYIVNYLADGTVKARAIGGLVGKWFRVRKFLGAADRAIPKESGKDEAGGDRI
jgi:hypothetical protein